MSSITSSPLLECAIGIVLLWFLGASICSLIVELIAYFFHFRANQLWHSLSRLIGPDAGPGLAVADGARLAKTVPELGTALENFIENVPGVTKETISRVKEVGSPAAAQALVAALAKDEESFSGTQLGALLRNLPPTVKNDKQQLRDWLERWYDGTMSTVSSTYRKNIRLWTALIGVLIAAIGGLDSISVAQQLYRSPSERAVVVATANQLTAPTDATVTTSTSTSTPTSVPAPAGTNSAPATTATTQPSSSVAPPATPPTAPASSTSDATTEQCPGNLDARFACVQKAADSITSLHLSVWQTRKKDRNALWLLLLGIAATWAAMAAGAPFWFDVLKRLSGLRSQSSTPST